MQTQLDHTSTIYEVVFEMVMFLETYDWTTPVTISINVPNTQDDDDKKPAIEPKSKQFTQIQGIHLYKNRLTIQGSPQPFRFEDIETITYTH